MTADTGSTPSEPTVLTGLERVRRTAREDKQVRFTALLHHLTVDLLRESFLSLKRKAAPGVDGQTWKQYETQLEEKLVDLHGRVHREPIGRNLQGECIWRNQMAGNGRWASRCWKTK